ncbi:hypothetical protein AYI70_g6185 [Smittium culicis]|uniref:PH domain-containing protein n=1 Tax=Smittium culicis TaxID=133412 RepID=A0A1R1XR70_9FUNG|nr:hypothetical protein AYI70_g6185 [Smittium culicis]
MERSVAAANAPRNSRVYQRFCQVQSVHQIPAHFSVAAFCLDAVVSFIRSANDRNINTNTNNNAKNQKDSQNNTKALSRKLSYQLVVKFPSIQLFHTWYQETSKWIRYSNSLFPSKPLINLTPSFIYPPLHVKVRIPSIDISVNVSTLQAYVKGSGKSFIDNINNFAYSSPLPNPTNNTASINSSRNSNININIMHQSRSNPSHFTNPLYKQEQHLSSKATVWDIRDIVLYSLATSPRYSSFAIDLIKSHAQNSLSIAMAWAKFGSVDFVAPLTYTQIPQAIKSVDGFSENELAFSYQSMQSSYCLELRTYKPDLSNPGNTEFTPMYPISGYVLAFINSKVRVPNTKEVDTITKNSRFKIPNFELVGSKKKSSSSSLMSTSLDIANSADLWFVIEFRSHNEDTDKNIFFVCCPSVKARDSWVKHLGQIVAFWKSHNLNHKKTRTLLKYFQSSKLPNNLQVDLERDLEAKNSIANKIFWNTNRSYIYTDVIHHSFLYRKNKKHKAFRRFLCLLTPGRMVEFAVPKLTGIETMDALKNSIRDLYVSNSSETPFTQSRLSTLISTNKWPNFYYKRVKFISLKSVYVTSNPSGIFKAYDKSEAPKITYQNYINFYKADSNSSSPSVSDDYINNKPSINTDDYKPKHQAQNSSLEKNTNQKSTLNNLSQTYLNNRNIPRSRITLAKNSKSPQLGFDYLENEITYAPLVADRFQIDGEISHDDISLCAFTFLNPVSKFSYFDSTIHQKAPLSIHKISDSLLDAFEQELENYCKSVNTSSKGGGYCENSFLHPFISITDNTVDHADLNSVKNSRLSIISTAADSLINMIKKQTDVADQLPGETGSIANPNTKRDTLSMNSSQILHKNETSNLNDKHNINAIPAYYYLNKISYKIPFSVIKPILVDLGLAYPESSSWTDTEIRSFNLTPESYPETLDTRMNNTSKNFNANPDDHSLTSFLKSMCCKPDTLYKLSRYGNYITPISKSGKCAKSSNINSALQDSSASSCSKKHSKTFQISSIAPTINDFGETISELLGTTSPKNTKTTTITSQDIKAPLICLNVHSVKPDYEFISSLSKYSGFDQYQAVYIAESQDEMKLWVTILDNHISNLVADQLW